MTDKELFTWAWIMLRDKHIPNGEPHISDLFISPPIVYIFVPIMIGMHYLDKAHNLKEKLFTRKS